MRSAILLLGLIAVLSLKATAISFSSDYLINDTMELIAGTSRIYGIRLQNPADNEAAVKVDYDRNLTKIIEYLEVYTLPPKTTGYRILFNVTAPKQPGLYKVGFTVSEVEPAAGGSVPVRLKINRNFNLKVIMEPNSRDLSRQHASYYYMTGYAVILALAAFAVFKMALGKNRKIIGKNRKIIK